MNWLYLEILIGAFSVIIFVIYSVSIIRILLLEHKIKSLEAERNKKIEQTKSVPGVIKIIVEGQINSIKDQYEPELVRLKRDRQFILDKLPFIKK